MRFCNAHLCEADSRAFYTWLFYSVGDEKKEERSDHDNKSQRKMVHEKVIKKKKKLT